jgi:hypothetical protein
MDDTADKVRRNVVTFSAAIIGMTFLQLKVEKIGILGIELSGMSPLRVMIALFVVLIYLFLRYHFDENTEKERASSRMSFLHAREPGVARILSSDIKRVLMNGTGSKYVENIPWITDDFDAVKRHAGDFIDYSIHATSQNNFASRSGETSLTAVFHKGGMGDHWHGLHRGTQYTIPKATWHMLTAWTALRQTIYSRSSVNVFLPYILAASAAVILICKILEALPPSI